jgi:hypothetical protein
MDAAFVNWLALITQTAVEDKGIIKGTSINPLCAD